MKVGVDWNVCGEMKFLSFFALEIYVNFFPFHSFIHVNYCQEIEKNRIHVYFNKFNSVFFLLQSIFNTITTTTTTNDDEEWVREVKHHKNETMAWKTDQLIKPFVPREFIHFISFHNHSVFIQHLCRKDLNKN